MKRRALACIAGTLVVILVFPFATTSSAQPSARESGKSALGKRLVGARLVYHRADPKLAWSFSSKAFLLEIGGETVPRKLIETLTGKPVEVARIAGTWTLDKEAHELVLIVSRADGQAIVNRARLSIFVAGRVRIDLGDYQYNVFSGEADLKPNDPKLTFTQSGKDLVITMSIEIPDAPHIAWTHNNLVMDHDPYLKGPRRPPRLSSVELTYHIIQCRDDPVLMHMRHRKKKVNVTWRVLNHQKADVPYCAVDRFDPSAAELDELAPKLSKLAEETRQRARQAIP